VMANWRLRRVRRAEKILHLTKADELRDAQQDDADEVEQLLHDPYRKSEEPQGQRKRQLGLTNQKLDGAVTLLALCADPADPNFERLTHYEQRLQNVVHRCLRDLKQLRKDREKDLRPSIYAREAEEEMQPRRREDV